jgi:hypothetical protein
MSRSSAAGRGLATTTMMAGNGSFSCASLLQQLRHPITGTKNSASSYIAGSEATVDDIAFVRMALN